MYNRERERKRRKREGEKERERERDRDRQRERERERERESTNAPLVMLQISSQRKDHDARGSDLAAEQVRVNHLTEEVYVYDSV